MMEWEREGLYIAGDFLKKMDFVHVSVSYKSQKPITV